MHRLRFLFLTNEDEEQSMPGEAIKVEKGALETETLESPLETGTKLSDIPAHLSFLLAGSKKKSTINSLIASFKRIGEAKQAKQLSKKAVDLSNIIIEPLLPSAPDRELLEPATRKRFWSQQEQ